MKSQKQVIPISITVIAVYYLYTGLAAFVESLGSFTHGRFYLNIAIVCFPIGFGIFSKRIFWLVLGRGYCVVTIMHCIFMLWEIKDLDTSLSFTIFDKMVYNATTEVYYALVMLVLIFYSWQLKVLFDKKEIDSFK